MEIENESQPTQGYTARTSWGITLIGVSLLFGVIAIISSIITMMNGQMNLDSLSSTGLSASTLLLSCLTPLAGILELIGIILLFQDSKKVSNLHRRLTLAGLVILALTFILSVVIPIPLGYIGTTTGNIDMMRVTYFIQMGSIILSSAFYVVVAWGITQIVHKSALIFSGVLASIGSIGAQIMASSTLKMQQMTMNGISVYTFLPDLNYTSGLYPLLNIVSLTGSVIAMVVYIVLAIQTWKQALINEENNEDLA